jgi:hypothetical protein
MIRFIEGIWLAAGCIGVVGTLWLCVASKLGLWPFRRDIDRVPARLSPGEFWFDIPGGGLVHGYGTLEQGLAFWNEFYVAPVDHEWAMGLLREINEPTPDQWFKGN